MHLLALLFAVVAVLWLISAFLNGAQIGRVFMIALIACATPFVWGIIMVVAWGTFSHYAAEPPAAAVLFATVVCLPLAAWLIHLCNRRYSRAGGY